MGTHGRRGGEGRPHGRLGGKAGHARAITFGSIYQNFDDAEKVRRTAGVEIVIVLSAGSWHTTRGRLENGIVDWRGVKGGVWVDLPLKNYPYCMARDFVPEQPKEEVCS